MADRDRLIDIALLGVAGYLGYQYIYLPYKVRSDLERQAAIIRAQQPSISKADSYQIAGDLLCKGASAAVGAFAGGPAGAATGLKASSLYCGTVSKAVGTVVKDTVKIVKVGAGAVEKAAKTTFGFLKRLF